VNDNLSRKETARAGTALVIIDMISAWDYPQGDHMLRSALRIGPAIARLKQRCARLSVPVIYANDNAGHWRSDIRQLVALSESVGGTATALTQLLAPALEDYVMLKPKHSAFFATPLDLLLQHIGVTHLILAGVSSDACVLATALDARMRDYELVVPRDCIGSLTPRRTAASLTYFRQVLQVPTTTSSRIRLA
jgi:nicotinamidase-related amidase